IAIVSAMRASGFVRADGDLMRFIALPPDESSKWGQWAQLSPEQAQPFSQRILVPYEWFKADETVPLEAPNYSHVLVLWLKEDEFIPKPFERFACLWAALLRGVQSTNNLSLGILGPRSSGGLQAMIEDVSLAGTNSPAWVFTEADKQALRLLRSCNIISTSASAPDFVFLP